ncbi:hypothetical protein RFI_17790 [Reticulomyxa filosa]|uniref:Uncharacterized protein n=1 Tax=Reticulomyxa filosa TaxID=46433 RepID=X6N071_RETFI|nr:hypothetical protein RFI_17790 [Reticulomyxa filosa]|eukprot:ETO19441.1 hypothetical protein RFI_17790 [Reticulomyxa filosa]
MNERSRNSKNFLGGGKKKTKTGQLWNRYPCCRWLSLSAKLPLSSWDHTASKEAVVKASTTKAKRKTAKKKEEPALLPTDQEPKPKVKKKKKKSKTHTLVYNIPNGKHKKKKKKKACKEVQMHKSKEDISVCIQQIVENSKKWPEQKTGLQGWLHGVSLLLYHYDHSNHDSQQRVLSHLQTLCLNVFACKHNTSLGSEPPNPTATRWVMSQQLFSSLFDTIVMSIAIENPAFSLLQERTLWKPIHWLFHSFLQDSVEWEQDSFLDPLSKLYFFKHVWLARVEFVESCRTDYDS